MSIPTLGTRGGALVVLLVALLLYPASLIEAHGYDALSYAHAVLVGGAEPEGLFHPHHLIYNVVGRGVYRLWQALGWTGGSLYPLQALNVLLSVTCLLLFYALLARRTRWQTALATTLLLALTHGYWLYSVEVEVYILSVTLLVATLAALLRVPVRARGGALVGLLLGLAVLGHQTNVLFLPVVLVAVATSRASRAAQRRYLLGFGAALAGVVGLAYGAAIRFLGLGSWARIVNWLTAYAQLGAWGRAELGQLPLALRGLGNTFVAGRSGNSVLGGLLVLLLWLLLLRIAWRADPWLARLCGVWGGTYALFVAWWEPANVEFWIAVLPPLLVVLALAVDALPRWAQRGAWGVLVLLILLVGWTNWEAKLAGGQHLANDLRAQAALALAACTDAGETLFVATYHLLPWLNYYTRVQAMPVEQGFLEAASDGSASPAEAGFQWVERTATEALRRDGRFFVAGEVLEELPSLAEPYGLVPGSFERFFQRYSLMATACTYTAIYLPGAPTYPLYVAESRSAP